MTKVRVVFVHQHWCLQAVAVTLGRIPNIYFIFYRDNTENRRFLRILSLANEFRFKVQRTLVHATMSRGVGDRVFHSQVSFIGIF